jgi:hypothetical protein
VVWLRIKFLCLDTVLLHGWFLTFQRFVDTYQKNGIFISCFPRGILLRHTSISCGVFKTSGGGNSSEFVVFHYSVQLNFWLCRRFFFGGMRVTLLKKRHCIAVSMNWSLRAVISLHPLILVCCNHMTVLLVTGAVQSWVWRMKGCREHTAEHK